MIVRDAQRRGCSGAHAEYRDRRHLAPERMIDTSASVRVEVLGTPTVGNMCAGLKNRSTRDLGTTGGIPDPTGPLGFGLVMVVEVFQPRHQGDQNTRNLCPWKLEQSNSRGGSRCSFWTASSTCRAARWPRSQPRSSTRPRTQCCCERPAPPQRGNVRTRQRQSKDGKHRLDTGLKHCLKRQRQPCRSHRHPRTLV